MEAHEITKDVFEPDALCMLNVLDVQPRGRVAIALAEQTEAGTKITVHDVVDAMKRLAGRNIAGALKMIRPSLRRIINRESYSSRDLAGRQRRTVGDIVQVTRQNGYCLQLEHELLHPGELFS